jgi:hypothetical protein
LFLPLLLSVALGAACQVPPANADPDPRTRGIDAGTIKSTVKLQRVHPRLLIKTKREERLDCSKDNDCAFWSRPCSCPPCGEVWREVVNRKELARLNFQWARARCMQPVCEKCEGRYLGEKPICFAGQCAAR